MESAGQRKVEASVAFCHGRGVQDGAPKGEAKPVNSYGRICIRQDLHMSYIYIYLDLNI